VHRPLHFSTEKPEELREVEDDEGNMKTEYGLRLKEWYIPRHWQGRYFRAFRTLARETFYIDVYEMEAWGYPRGPGIWDKIESTVCGYGFGCTNQDQQLYIQGKAYLTDVTRSDVSECKKVCESHGDCRGFQWYANTCYFRRSTTCARRVYSPVKDCYAVSFAGTEPEITLAEKFYGTEIGDFAAVSDKKSLFPLNEDCLADHRNSWDYQCRDSNGNFADFDHGHATTKCIRENVEFSERSLNLCGFDDGFTLTVGVFGVSSWSSIWLMNARDAHKYRAYNVTKIIEDMAIGDAVHSALGCQEKCKENESCEVFTYYATDERGELVLDQCFLYKNVEEDACGSELAPIRPMPGATMGYVRTRDGNMEC
jgi:hypothetical protein